MSDHGRRLSTDRDKALDQEKALDSSKKSRSSLEAAQLHLQRALGQAQPGREGDWSRVVLLTLVAAREAIENHLREMELPRGLYEEIQFEAPRLTPRVIQCTRQLRRIAAEARDLEAEVERAQKGDLQGLGAIRSDAERLLTSLRDVIAKENDLVFERFNEPPALD